MAPISYDSVGCRTKRVLVWAVLVLLSAAWAAGCGKKGPPQLPDAAAPVRIDDLAALREGDDIVLTWSPTVLTDDTAVAGYHIYRSAEAAGGSDDCRGCPVLFRRVADVPASGENATDQKIAYREPLMAGTHYRFKVVPYDSQGRLGPDSNIVRFDPE